MKQAHQEPMMLLDLLIIGPGIQPQRPVMIGAGREAYLLDEEHRRLVYLLGTRSQQPVILAGEPGFSPGDTQEQRHSLG
jgi:hypothetical protein